MLNNEYRGWSLKNDGVTQSFVNSFIQCKRTCYERYINGWIPKNKSVWFEFGTVFQYVIEQVFNEVTSKPIEITEIIKKHIANYENEVKDKNVNLDTDEIEYSEIIYSLAEKMLPLYFQYRASDFEAEVIYNETEFCLDFELDDCKEIKIVPIRGKIDLGLKKNNKLWIYDTKCLSVIQPDIIVGTVQHEIQPMLYLWASHVMNDNPTGFSYNIIRRPSQRRKKDEKINDFTDRIMEDIVNRPEHYFLRINMEISKDEVNSWFVNEFLFILTEISKWEYNEFYPRYINPNTLQTKYGKSQYFELLCHKNQTLYYKALKPFSEL